MDSLDDDFYETETREFITDALKKTINMHRHFWCPLTLLITQTLFLLEFKMPRLGTEDGKKALVPLPPLEEQEEIVKIFEELLPLCK